MQTFLPYPDFAKSAKCLDTKRLGKQRVEVIQILRALAGETKGWTNHSAVRMWRGHAGRLAVYGITICVEWRNRGYADSCLGKIAEWLPLCGLARPPWLGDIAFHASHRSNLLRKDPDHYGQFGWGESSDLDYVWPS